jgi:hypothetical protein
VIRLGRFQRDTLASLAASPDGLTSADLAVLSVSGDSAHAGRVLDILGRRGLAARPGRWRAPAGTGNLGRRPEVWVITPAGREAVDALLAAGSARSREQIRLDRRAAAAAIADGMGPDTPCQDAMARVAEMRRAGCNDRDISLVFAVPLTTVAGWGGAR